MKIKTKLQMATALAVVFSALLGCDREPQTETRPEPRYKTAYTETPPGMSIVCDKGRGLFAPAWGNSVWAGEKHANREEAIQHAWWLYVKMTNSPSNSYDWRQCD